MNGFDRNGSVHSFDFDLLGRQTADRITTLGGGVDGAVRRIGATFEVRGLPRNITSYDNATVGSGNIVNDVQFAYNSYWQLLADYQSHSGAVNVTTTPKVQYAYADGSANTIRPTTLTYPNGRALNYNYGTAGGTSDSASRIASLIDNDGTTHLADYSYLGGSFSPLSPRGRGAGGEGAIVQVNSPQPGIQYTLVGIQAGNDPVTGDIYRGLDLFSRVKDLIWAPLGGSSSSSSSSSTAGTNLVRIQHGYDRASNRLYRKDLVAASFGKAFDELYSYDRLYRLANMQRGSLNTTNTSISSGTQTFGQCWTLDATGNWKGFREDDTGSGTWNLVQSRSANTVNEITGITNSVGSAWANPVYDHNGNMTTIPQPANPAQKYTGTYDAWNRLVKLVDPSTGQTVQTNAYDGRRYRTIRNSFTAGVLSETRQYFYTSSWQSIEERVGSSTSAERQFVWGQRFIDDLVLRDRDTTGAGTLNERMYAIQDPLGSVVAIASQLGIVQERSAYAPYGSTESLAPGFSERSGTLFDWETLFGSYRFDPATEMYIVRERILNPVIGTWLTQDPLGIAASMNLYSYVGQAPSGSTDPSGLQRAPRGANPGIEPGPSESLSLEELIERFMQALDKLDKEICADRCRRWVARQLKKLKWLKNLPDCPCSLTDIDPKDPKSGWTAPEKADQRFHPGAAQCVRSTIQFGLDPYPSGQQCCFDAQGDLITNGPGAGTPDWISPDTAVLPGGNAAAHFVVDVQPFIECQKAGLVGEYLKARPPNDGGANNCAANPPKA